METKKFRHVDLERKSICFFSIGIFASLSLIVIAFEWSQPVSSLALPPKTVGEFLPVIDIPVTEVVPPAPKPSKAVIISEVKDDENQEDLEIPLIDMEEPDTTSYVPPAIPKEEPEDAGNIFLFVEESAIPKGGFDSFYKYVAERIKYPATARRIGTEGKVYLTFIVNKDGSLTDVEIVKGIGAGCDEEALRILRAAPAWNPGKQRGKPVRQRYTLAVYFQLN